MDHAELHQEPKASSKCGMCPDQSWKRGDDANAGRGRIPTGIGLPSSNSGSGTTVFKTVVGV